MVGSAKFFGVTAAIAVVIGSAPQSARAAEATLCRPGERVIFSCPIKQKIVSVCASGGELRLGSDFQYRFGAPGALEMQFPAEAKGGLQSFRFSNVPYAGGGEAHLRFTQGGYDYVVYDTTVAHTPNEGADFEAGILVLRQGKRAAHLRCSVIGDHAGIDGRVYDVAPKEKYVPYMGP